MGKLRRSALFLLTFIAVCGPTFASAVDLSPISASGIPEKELATMTKPELATLTIMGQFRIRLLSRQEVEELNLVIDEAFRDPKSTHIKRVLTHWKGALLLDQIMTAAKIRCLHQSSDIPCDFSGPDVLNLRKPDVEAHTFVEREWYVSDETNASLKVFWPIAEDLFSLRMDLYTWGKEQRRHEDKAAKSSDRLKLRMANLDLIVAVVDRYIPTLSEKERRVFGVITRSAKELLSEQDLANFKLAMLDALRDRKSPHFLIRLGEWKERFRRAQIINTAVVRCDESGRNNPSACEYPAEVIPELSASYAKIGISPDLIKKNESFMLYLRKLSTERYDLQKSSVDRARIQLKNSGQILALMAGLSVNPGPK